MKDRDIDARVTRHLQRMGISREQFHTDTQLHYADRLLRSTLRLLEAAMEDEGIDEATASRVIDLVIFGAVPTEADVAARLARDRQMLDMIERQPLVFPKEWKL